MYLDDIHVASATAEDHLGHPSQLFQQLNEHGLIVKPAKCQFGLAAIDFLGHHVSFQGVRPLPANRFIPHAADLMKPLYEALRGKKDSDGVDWSLERVWATDGTIAKFQITILVAQNILI